VKGRKIILTNGQRKEVKELFRLYRRLKFRSLRSRGIRMRHWTRNPEEHKDWDHFVQCYQMAHQNGVPPEEFLLAQFKWFDHFLGGTPRPQNLHDGAAYKRWVFVSKYLR